MRTRKIEAVRGLWGLGLLLAPKRALVLEGAQHDEAAVVVVRVLGARQLAQALLSGVEPSPEVLAMGVWVDAVHALTAVGLAAVDSSRARAGLTDAAVALTFAGVGLHDLQRSHGTRGSHDRRRDVLATAVLHLVPGGVLLLRRAEKARRRQSGVVRSAVRLVGSAA